MNGIRTTSYHPDFDGSSGTYTATTYSSPRSVSERCRDYVHTKPSPKTPQQEALSLVGALNKAVADDDKKKGSVDYGGDFEVVRRLREWNQPQNATYSNDSFPPYYGKTENWVGGWQNPLPANDVVPILQVGHPDFGDDPLGLRTYWGPIFFDRANITKPKASLAQFALELLLDVPQIPLQLLTQLFRLKSVGKEYLNVEFGWLPLFGDIVKAVHTLNKVDKILIQLKRDSERGVRRKMELWSESTTPESSSNIGYYLPSRPSQWLPDFGANAQRTIETHVKKRVWGSGRFRYHFEGYKELGLTSQQLRVISGIEVNPRLVYELLPWSWLVDWYSNLGPIISNWVSMSEDAFVADYAYVMGSIEITTTDISSGPYYSSIQNGEKGGTSTVSLVTRTRDEYKARYGATPYGFGLNPASFSSRKWAILVALGLAKFDPS